MTTQLDPQVTPTHHDSVARGRGSEYWLRRSIQYFVVFLVLGMVAYYTGWYYPIWALPAFAAAFCAFEAWVQRKPIERPAPPGHVRQVVDQARAERAEAEGLLAEERRRRNAK